MALVVGGYLSATMATSLGGAAAIRRHAPILAVVAVIGALATYLIAGPLLGGIPSGHFLELWGIFTFLMLAVAFAAAALQVSGIALAPLVPGTVQTLSYRPGRRFEERLDERGISHSGVKDRGFMDSIYFNDPLGLLIELASYRFEPPAGHTHADVLMAAQRLRVERGDRNPQFADALLRIKFIRLPPDCPTLVDRMNRDSNASVEASAKLGDSLAQIGRGADRYPGRTWPERRRPRLDRSRSSDLRQGGSDQSHVETPCD